MNYLNRSGALRLLVLAASMGTLGTQAHAALLKKQALSPRIQALVTKCNQAAKNLDADTVACPQVEKYVIGGKTPLTQKKVEELIESELSYDLTRSSAKAAAELIVKDFELNLEFQSETLSEGSGQYTPAQEAKIRRSMDAAEKAVADLAAIISDSASSPGAAAYVDRTTSWAPSVNARAAIITNLSRRTVYVYLHGDLDG